MTENVGLRAAFFSLICTFITSDTSITWYPTQDNRLSSTDQWPVDSSLWWMRSIVMAFRRQHWQYYNADKTTASHWRPGETERLSTGTDCWTHNSTADKPMSQHKASTIWHRLITTDYVQQKTRWRSCLRNSRKLDTPGKLVFYTVSEWVSSFLAAHQHN